jgi:uncharacterized protein YunC (DUF1805 family)
MRSIVMGSDEEGINLPVNQPAVFSPGTGNFSVMDQEPFVIIKKLRLQNGEATGFIVPLGPVNLVAAVAARGMIGCGAFDVIALDRFAYAAARVQGPAGRPVMSIDDLREGVVKVVNNAAAALGVREEMSGSEALDLLAT